MVLGMDKNTSWPDFRDEFARRIEHPLKPMIVDAGDATCKENIMMGKDVNLFGFPWPFIHQVDGGRYGTVSVTQIVKDPDTGWVNWGNYRFMVVGKNRMVGLQVFGQHGPTIFYTKWEARGKECPFVYAIGGDPGILFASGIPLPAGVCEADYAGGLRQEPLRVVRAETSDLYVPADAEIVIEGVILPKLRLDEGPVGEYTGYIHGRQPMPVYQVQCVTYRSNPIIAMSIEGVSFNDNMGIFSSITNTEFYRHLRNAGFPVKDVRSLTEASYGCLVVSTEVPYEGYIQDLRNFLDSHKITIWGTSSIIVDSDVNIADEDCSANVYQEMATKIDPRRDIYRTENDILTTPLNPSVDAKGRLTGVAATRRSSAARIRATTLPRRSRICTAPFARSFSRFSNLSVVVSRSSRTSRTSSARWNCRRKCWRLFPPARSGCCSTRPTSSRPRSIRSAMQRWAACFANWATVCTSRTSRI